MSVDVGAELEAHISLHEIWSVDEWSVCGQRRQFDQSAAPKSDVTQKQ